MLVSTGDRYITWKYHIRKVVNIDNWKTHRSVSPGALFKELRGHEAAHKASNEVRIFDPRGIYHPAAVTAASLGKGGDRVLVCMSAFPFLRFWFQFCIRFTISLQQFNSRYERLCAYFSDMPVHSALSFSWRSANLLRISRLMFP